jgi:PmbA protein
MSEDARQLLEQVQAAGWQQVEVYAKRGRSRRFERGTEGEVVGSAEEAGWAVRAGNARRSLFHAEAGPTVPVGPWQASAPGGLALPEPLPVTEWREPEGAERPPPAEREGLAVLEKLASRLQAEQGSARLLRAVLEEGTSSVTIVNSLGVEGSYCARSAYLRVEADAPPRTSALSAVTAGVSSRGLDVDGLARRFADLLTVARDGQAAAADPCRMVLAPEVGACVVASLAPRLVGVPQHALREWFGEQGECGAASPMVSLVDDARLRDGPLAAPFDGEGVPTGERVLVEEGSVSGSLEPWGRAGAATIGCRRRAGWRDLPRLSASHLFVRPHGEVVAADLLAELEKGYYLIGARGDLEMRGALASLRVCGFEVCRGRLVAPVVGRLQWNPARVLSHVYGVASDLRFQPFGAMMGAPTMLVAELALTPEP